ncbi:hypothetical protein O1157_13980 [Streptomyces albogriseolus]
MPPGILAHEATHRARRPDSPPGLTGSTGAARHPTVPPGILAHEATHRARRPDSPPGLTGSTGAARHPTVLAGRPPGSRQFAAGARPAAGARRT